jgi:hypothetical protein
VTPNPMLRTAFVLIFFNYYQYIFIAHKVQKNIQVKGKIIRILVCMLIHSSYCVLNFTMPAFKPIFATVAYTT